MDKLILLGELLSDDIRNDESIELEFNPKEERMRVLRDNVAVVNVRPMEDKAGDIFLPEAGMIYGDDAAVSSRRYEAEKGEVVAVGPEVRDLAIGDTVYVHPLKGKEYTMAGETVKVYRLEEMLGVVRD